MKSITTILLTAFLSLFAFTGIFAQDAIEFPEPCSITGPKYGTDSATSVRNLSLYRENYKQWKSSRYKNDAILYTVEPWRYCFLNAPKASQNIYFDGLKIVNYLMKQTEDSTLKERYVDTLFMIHDQNIMAYGCSKKYGEAYVLGRKGYDLYNYRINELDLVYETLKRSYDLGGDNTEAAVMSIFYKVLDKMVRREKADTTLLFEYYDKLTISIDVQLKNYKKKIAEKPGDSVKLNKKIKLLKIAEGNVSSIFNPWADCEQIVKIYAPKFEKNKEDADWLRKLNALMDKKGCIEDPLYFQAAEALYVLEPSPSAAYALGKSFYKVDKNTEAVKYLLEATEGIEDSIEKSEAYLVLADVYKKLGQYANSRNAALNSLKYDSKNGMAYILIGDLYMMSAVSCGDNPVTKRAGYWAAADKYARAKAVSDNDKVIKTANTKYGSAYAGFPKSEDMFFYNVVKGSSYTISCWYTEVTIARSSD